MGNMYMDVSERCTKMATEYVRGERWQAGREDSVAHSGNTAVQREPRQRQQASEERSMLAGREDYVAHPSNTAAQRAPSHRQQASEERSMLAGPEDYVAHSSNTAAQRASRHRQQASGEQSMLAGREDYVAHSSNTAAQRASRHRQQASEEQSMLAGREDYVAHSSNTAAQRAPRHRQQASDAQSMQGGAAEVARRADCATLFLRDLRGLEEIPPPVVAVVGGDVLMDPMRRFDAGLRTLREEFTVAPHIIYADQRLNERASLGQLHSPHRRELRIVRSPKPTAHVRSGLARALSGAVTSRCEEIIE